MVAYNIDLKDKTILITGAAGFIGANLAKRLLTEFEHITIIGIDNITDYYDVCLKHERLNELAAFGKRFSFIKKILPTSKLLSIFLMSVIRKLSLIWRPKQVCDTASLILIHMSKVILSVFTIFWRHVAIMM